MMMMMMMILLLLSWRSDCIDNGIDTDDVAMLVCFGVKKWCCPEKGWLPAHKNNETIDRRNKIPWNIPQSQKQRAKMF